MTFRSIRLLAPFAGVGIRRASRERVVEQEKVGREQALQGRSQGPFQESLVHGLANALNQRIRRARAGVDMPVFIGQDGGGEGGARGSVSDARPVVMYALKLSNKVKRRAPWARAGKDGGDLQANVGRTPERTAEKLADELDGTLAGAQGMLQQDGREAVVEPPL